MRKHYGKDTDEDVAMVKKLYEDLQVPEKVSADRNRLAKALYEDYDRLIEEKFIFADVFKKHLDTCVMQTLF